MLATKNTSRKTTTYYLIALGAVAAIVAGYLLFNYFSASGSEESTLGEDGSLDLKDYAVIIKPKYGLDRLKKFDLNIFNDSRFRTLLEFPKSAENKPLVGKTNPFVPKLKATSSESGSNQ